MIGQLSLWLAQHEALGVILTLSDDQLVDIYEVLVEEFAAPRNPSTRAFFIAQSSSSSSFRFDGGGRKWRIHYGEAIVYVDYDLRDHQTPERDERCREANERIREIVERQSAH